MLLASRSWWRVGLGSHTPRLAAPATHHDSRPLLIHLATHTSPLTPHHALAKAVYGVTFDPFDDTRLATYSDDADGIVKVWDVRKLKDSEPLVSLAAGDEQGAGAPPPARGSSGARGGKALAQAGWRPLTTPHPHP